MPTARDIMHNGAECVMQGDTVAQAAAMMRDLHVGSLPICGEDGRLHGILTDRDIVVHCVAGGYDPEIVTAHDLARGTLIWVDADASTSEVLRLMESHQIRRVPVLADHQLVGMISEADLAVHLTDSEVSGYTRAVYSAPPSS
jgi:CBS domain-containing protein